jgi:hypothetical protein
VVIVKVLAVAEVLIIPVPTTFKVSVAPVALAVPVVALTNPNELEGVVPPPVGLLIPPFS